MPAGEPMPRREWPQILLRGALPLSMPIVLLGGIYWRRLHADRSGGDGGRLCADARRARLPRADLAAALRACFVESRARRRGRAHHRRRVPVQLRLRLRRRAAGDRVGSAGMRPVAAAFLLLVNLLFLVLGCFLDATVLLLVFVPLLLPAAGRSASTWCISAWSSSST